ncbi:hypothetical protein J6590_015435 [Homalodisca vitripennis]|nr:hypothetical protein J6590_015435 [Homalodisca vitripennis]
MVRRKRVPEKRENQNPNHPQRTSSKFGQHRAGSLINRDQLTRQDSAAEIKVDDSKSRQGEAPYKEKSTGGSWELYWATGAVCRIWARAQMVTSRTSPSHYRYVGNVGPSLRPRALSLPNHFQNTVLRDILFHRHARRWVLGARLQPQPCVLRQAGDMCGLHRCVYFCPSAREPPQPTLSSPLESSRACSFSPSRLRFSAMNEDNSAVAQRRGHGWPGYVRCGLVIRISVESRRGAALSGTARLEECGRGGAAPGGGGGREQGVAGWQYGAKKCPGRRPGDGTEVIPRLTVGLGMNRGLSRSLTPASRREARGRRGRADIWGWAGQRCVLTPIRHFPAQLPGRRSAQPPRRHTPNESEVPHPGSDPSRV